MSKKIPKFKSLNYFATHPSILPGAVFPRQFQDEFFNFNGGGRTSRFADDIPIVFPSYQAPMPCQQGVRRHQAGESIQRLRPQPLALDRQALALAIIEPRFLAQQFFKHTDFFL
ncbi:MAG: hypothetical protein ABSH48_25775 [Verrucomicrobiota bacterium]